MCQCNRTTTRDSIVTTLNNKVAVHIHTVDSAPETKTRRELREELAVLRVGAQTKDAEARITAIKQVLDTWSPEARAGALAYRRSVSKNLVTVHAAPSGWKRSKGRPAKPRALRKTGDAALDATLNSAFTEDEKMAQLTKRLHELGVPRATARDKAAELLGEETDDAWSKEAREAAAEYRKTHSNPKTPEDVHNDVGRVAVGILHNAIKSGKAEGPGFAEKENAIRLARTAVRHSGVLSPELSRWAGLPSDRASSGSWGSSGYNDRFNSNRALGHLAAAHEYFDDPTERGAQYGAKIKPSDVSRYAKLQKELNPKGDINPAYQKAIYGESQVVPGRRS